MDALDDILTVVERLMMVFFELGGGFFSGKRHIGIVKRPEFFKIADYLAVIDDFLNVTVGGADFAAFDQFGNFLIGEVVAFDSSTIVDGTDNGFFLELFFVGRDKRGLIDDGLGGFDSANIF